MKLSGKTILSMFAEGPHAYTIAGNGIPMDAKILNLEYDADNEVITLTLYSSEFEEIVIPEMIPSIKQ